MHMDRVRRSLIAYGWDSSSPHRQRRRDPARVSSPRSSGAALSNCLLRVEFKVSNSLCRSSIRLPISSSLRSELLPLLLEEPNNESISLDVCSTLNESTPGVRRQYRKEGGR